MKAFKLSNEQKQDYDELAESLSLNIAEDANMIIDEQSPTGARQVIRRYDVENEVYIPLTFDHLMGSDLQDELRIDFSSAIKQVKHDGNSNSSMPVNNENGADSDPVDEQAGDNDDFATSSESSSDYDGYNEDPEYSGPLSCCGNVIESIDGGGFKIGPKTLHYFDK